MIVKTSFRGLFDKVTSLGKIACVKLPIAQWNTKEMQVRTCHGGCKGPA